MIHSCGIFLITESWKVLIGKASKQGAHQLYSIPKGKCEDNENPLDAAIRELYEEANIDIDQSKYKIHELDIIQYPKKSKCLHPFFITSLKETDFPNIKCNSFAPSGKPELTDLEWKPMKECEQLLHPTQAEALAKIRTFLLTHQL
jgi:8-oxo-dGTP pyrophosphatase MutT (NUDIX family)